MRGIFFVFFRQPNAVVPIPEVILKYTETPRQAV